MSGRATVNAWGWDFVGCPSVADRDIVLIRHAKVRHKEERRATAAVPEGNEAIGLVRLQRVGSTRNRGNVQGY